MSSVSKVRRLSGCEEDGSLPLPPSSDDARRRRCEAEGGGAEDATRGRRADEAEECSGNSSGRSSSGSNRTSRTFTPENSFLAASAHCYLTDASDDVSPEAEDGWREEGAAAARGHEKAREKDLEEEKEEERNWTETVAHHRSVLLQVKSQLAAEPATRTSISSRRSCLLFEGGNGEIPYRQFQEDVQAVLRSLDEALQEQADDTSTDARDGLNPRKNRRLCTADTAQRAVGTGRNTLGNATEHKVGRREITFENSSGDGSKSPSKTYDGTKQTGGSAVGTGRNTLENATEQKSPNKTCDGTKQHGERAVRTRRNSLGTVSEHRSPYKTCDGTRQPGEIRRELTFDLSDIKCDAQMKHDTKYEYLHDTRIARRTKEKSYESNQDVKQFTEISSETIEKSRCTQIAQQNKEILYESNQNLKDSIAFSNGTNENSQGSNGDLCMTTGRWKDDGNDKPCGECKQRNTQEYFCTFSKTKCIDTHMEDLDFNRIEPNERQLTENINKENDELDNSFQSCNSEDEDNEIANDLNEENSMVSATNEHDQPADAACFPETADRDTPLPLPSPHLASPAAPPRPRTPPARRLHGGGGEGGQEDASTAQTSAPDGERTEATTAVTSSPPPPPPPPPSSARRRLLRWLTVAGDIGPFAEFWTLYRRLWNLVSRVRPRRRELTSIEESTGEGHEEGGEEKERDEREEARGERRGKGSSLHGYLSLFALVCLLCPWRVVSTDGIFDSPVLRRS